MFCCSPTPLTSYSSVSAPLVHELSVSVSGNRLNTCLFVSVHLKHLKKIKIPTSDKILNRRNTRRCGRRVVVGETGRARRNTRQLVACRASLPSDYRGDGCVSPPAKCSYIIVPLWTDFVLSPWRCWFCLRPHVSEIGNGELQLAYSGSHFTRCPLIDVVKLTVVAQLAKDFHGTRVFITLCAKAHHRPMSWGSFS